MAVNDFEESPSEETTVMDKNDNDIIASLEYFRTNKLTEEDLAIEFEYLIDNFMVIQSIMMIFAKGGAGKSLFTLALALYLLKSGKINVCIYLDMDNSTMALKNRHLDQIINEYPNLEYIHRSKAFKSPKDMIAMLAKDAPGGDDVFKGYLIVIDSVRDFLGGKDMNSDKDVGGLMEQLKMIRDAGATIVFLHHSRRSSEGNEYKGSSSFIDSIDVAYGLTKSDTATGSAAFALTVEKDRIPVENSGFELNIETMELTSGNYLVASMDEDEAEFVSSIQAVLDDNTNGVKQGDLLKAIDKSPDDKTSRSLLKKYDGTMWISIKKKEMNNATVYYPYIDDVPKLP